MHRSCGSDTMCCWVGERSVSLRRCAVRHAGPLGNWLCLLFMAAVLVIMLMTPGMAISVWLIPVWIVVLGVGYLFKEKAAATIKAQ